MATQNWLGTATTTAQVAAATFGTYDATTTRKITIGGATGASESVSISAADSGGTLTAALTALKNLLVASVHPYFSNITWTSTATTIVGTAKTAGVPFTFVGAVSGGTGTYGGYSVTTASTGPNDWSSANNWSSGAVPVATDDVYIKNSSVNICWGLGQSAVTLNSLTISKSYTGKIGLNTAVFTTDAAATTASATAETEYRQAYLQISSTTPILIGEIASLIGTATGSSRIMIDVGSVASQSVYILGTATSASETNKPAVRMLANAATIKFYVRSAPGGFGLAMDIPGETSTISALYVSDTSTSSKVIAGNGLTVTTWEQNGGINLLQATATVTTVNLKGGTLTTEGSFAITTANVYTGATFIPNSTGTITTMNPFGGTMDFTQNSNARTVTTMTWQKGSTATLKGDSSILTISTFTAPATKYQFSAS